MISTSTMLAVTLTFWITLSVGAWWHGRSWFPFTVVTPGFLIIVGKFCDNLSPSVGTTSLLILHAVLWIVLVWVVIVDAFKKETPMD